MQIATLAAQGLSNEEIAERLFISRHAVGAHLSHIRATTDELEELADVHDRVWPT